MKSKQKTILLALSGGVDSAVAVLLLKRQGHKVIGAFMKNFSDTKDPLTGQCSYLKDKKDSQKVAAQLNIPWVLFDFEKEYKKQVIEPMYKAYKKGKTPNPDITCNTIIKFPLLWREAKRLRIDAIATGHYARIRKGSTGYHLLTGKDPEKDQSYFLAELSQSDLEHSIFPLGNLTKQQVRQIAKKNHLFNWSKRGTSGICFVGKVSMRSFLERKIRAEKGKVITSEGVQLGTHKGLAFYTIGQKAGEHIGIIIRKPKKLAQKRFYVVEKKKPNTLIIAPEGHPALKKKEIVIKNLHLINPKEKIPKLLKARIRHLGKLQSGKLIKKNNKFCFIFNKPVGNIAEGQYLVLYKNQEVIGCGEMKPIPSAS